MQISSIASSRISTSTVHSALTCNTLYVCSLKTKQSVQSHPMYIWEKCDKINSHMTIGVCLKRRDGWSSYGVCVAASHNKGNWTGYTVHVDKDWSRVSEIQWEWVEPCNDSGGTIVEYEAVYDIITSPIWSPSQKIRATKRS